MPEVRLLGLWVIVAVFVVFVDSRKVKNMGPYEVVMKELAECYEQGTGEFSLTDIVLKKVGRDTMEGSALIVIKTPLDDSVEVFINNAMWGNGGWRRNALTYDLGPMPTAWKSTQPYIYETVFPQFASQLNVTDWPLPPGSVSASMTFSPKSLLNGRLAELLPELPYNKYKAEVIFKKGGKIIGCVAIIVDIVPKRD